jgi:hypothetical protein
VKIPRKKAYIGRIVQQEYAMIETTYRFSLFALYQFALFAGILLMPVALAARHVGLTIPVGEFVESIGEAYEQAAR